MGLSGRNRNLSEESLRVNRGRPCNIEEADVPISPRNGAYFTADRNHLRDSGTCPLSFLSARYESFDSTRCAARVLTAVRNALLLV